MYLYVLTVVNSNQAFWLEKRHWVLIHSITALGLLTLCITPSHRCFNHFFTPNPAMRQNATHTNATVGVWKIDLLFTSLLCFTFSVKSAENLIGSCSMTWTASTKKAGPVSTVATVIASEVNCCQLQGQLLQLWCRGFYWKWMANTSFLLGFGVHKASRSVF